jgi:spore coat protein U-like protein
MNASLHISLTTRNMKTLVKLAIAVSLGMATSAFAATTATVPVTANVVGDCSIAASGLSFGAYDRAAGNTGTATVTANCTLDLPASIAMDDGTNTGRQMSNGSSLLAYTLYKDSNRTQTWATGEDALSITGTGAEDTRTIYGAIAPSQNVSKGNYSDTITATITFAP